MTGRIPGSERTREALSDLIAGRLSSGDAKSAWVRLALPGAPHEEPFSQSARRRLARVQGPGHRRTTRTTNLLERLFVEGRRRLKIIPNAWACRPASRTAVSERGARL